MPEELSVAAPVVADQASLVPAPATAPVVAGDAQPGDGKPKGQPLSPEVHAAVTEERARSARYRGALEQLVVMDEQGEIVGLRPEVVEHVRTQIAAAPAAPTSDPEVAYRARIGEWATKLGFLPEQVEGVVTLAEAIARNIVSQETEPMVSANIESMKAGLIASDVVPKEAATFVAKWVDRARTMNARALLTPQGRETVLRQAIGEYYIQKARGGGRAPAGVPTPAMLRPSPGAQPGAQPTADEAAIRAKLGLTPAYTANTPREEVL